MSIQTLPYLLVYFAAFIISTAVFLYSWRNRTAPGVQAFAIAVLLEISWLLGYVFEINATSLEVKVFWDNFQYIGSLYAPIALLLFSLGFIGRKVNTRRLATLVGIIPTLVLVAIFTNLNPELIRINTQVLPGTPYAELNYDFGPIANIGNYYLYAISLAYIIVLITGFKRKEKNFRTQLWLVLLGTGIPIFSLILAQFLGIKFANQRDISPLFFVVSNAVIAFGVFRFRLFNILPIAREALFETIEDVLIILDTEDRIVDANSPARQLLPTTNLTGMPISEIMPELYEQFREVTEVRAEVTGAVETVYDLKITPLYDRSGNFIGRLINAHDITLQKNAEKEIQATSEQNQRRAEQFEAIAQVSRIISSIQEQGELLPRITHLISRHFGFYHAGIFLLDENKQFAILRAANSEDGKRMLERGHRLEVGQTGIVGHVTSTGSPRIALDTGADAVYFDNPDLPDTRSEMALPLMAGSQVIGALDVQSTESNAFTQEDIDILTVLADQVSIAIQNARLYEESREALAQAEALSRQLTGEVWADVRRFAPLVGYHFDGIRPEPLTQSTNGEQTKSQKDALFVPVQLRNETIGRLRIKSTTDGYEWTEDEVAIIRATAERVALAVENARLILESQKNAAKEQVIGEISSKIGAAINLDNILQTTLREMGRILPGAEISIQVDNE